MLKKNNYILDEISILKALRLSGLKSGTSVFLTTSLGMFGLNKGNNLNQLFLSCIKKIIGSKGNIFVPTYSYSFLDKKLKIFDIKKTKSKIGSFPNFILKQKNFTRSCDPFMSIAGNGPLVKKLFKNLPNTSFGNDCLFERLLKIKKLKNISLGVGPYWLPFNHHLDYINKVKYRYDKLFRGYLKINNNKKLIDWVYSVRPYQYQASASSEKVCNLALKKKIIKFISLGRSRIYVSDYKRIYNFTKNLQKKNKWILAKGPKCDLIKLEKFKFNKKKIISCNKISMQTLFEKQLNEFDDNTLSLQKLINTKFKTKIFKFNTGFNGINCIIPERIKKIKNKEVRGMGEVYVNEMILSRNKNNRYNLFICDISKLKSYRKFEKIIKKIQNQFSNSKDVAYKIIFIASHYAILSYLKLNINNLPKKIYYLKTKNKLFKKFLKNKIKNLNLKIYF